MDMLCKFFNWAYKDKETCLLLEGKVAVTPEGGLPINFSAGDLVTFPAGMNCRWEVHKAISKHYLYGA